MLRAVPGASACPLLPHREQGVPNQHERGCGGRGTVRCAREPRAAPRREGAGRSRGPAAAPGCSGEPHPRPPTAPSLAVVGRQGLAEEVKGSEGQEVSILFFHLNKETGGCSPLVFPAWGCSGHRSKGFALQSAVGGTVGPSPYGAALSGTERFGILPSARHCPAQLQFRGVQSGVLGSALSGLPIAGGVCEAEGDAMLRLPVFSLLPPSRVILASKGTKYPLEVKHPPCNHGRNQGKHRESQPQGENRVHEVPR